MQRSSFGETSFECQMDHFTEFFRKYIGRYRNNPRTAQCDHRQGQIVITRHHSKICRTTFQHISCLRKRTAGLLDRYNIREIVSQPKHGRGQHIHPGPARNVIQYDTTWCSLCNSFIVLINALLRRFIVIGCYRKNRIDPIEIARTKIRYDIGRTIPSRTENDRETPAVNLFHATDNSLTLLKRKRRCFGRRSEHDQIVCPSGDYMFDQMRQCGIIDRTVLCKRSYQGDSYTFHVRFHIKMLISAQK